MGECRTGSSRLRAGLPRGWEIAHKTGTGPDWRGASVGINDVGLVTAPDGHAYAVAVMMRQTRQPVPVRLRLMQAVSRAVAAAWGRDREALGADQKLASAGPPSRTAQ
jgi:beta-lactamase class A